MIQKNFNPVRTRRCFDIYATSFQRYGCCMDIETTLCAYWELITCAFPKPCVLAITGYGSCKDKKCVGMENHHFDCYLFNNNNNNTVVVM